jgi:acylphosphatase
VTEPDARLEAVVRGRVQGIGFRYFVLRRASRLGLVGWVANEPDGSLRCVVEGSPRALDELLGILRHGPPGARVDDVETSHGAPTGGFDHFTVRATGHTGD